MSGVASTFTMPAVPLAAGDTLLVVTTRHAVNTNAVTWNGVPLSEDVAVTPWGNGPMYTSIWSVYSTTAAVGDLVATTSGGVDSSIMLASSVLGLAPLGLDVQSSQSGTGTAADSGATGITSQPNEFVYATVSGDDAAGMTGSWASGFTEVYAAAGSMGETRDAWQLVTSTAQYSAGRTGFASQDWCAAVATYRVSSALEWMPTSSMMGPFASPLATTRYSPCAIEGATTPCSSPDGSLYWHYNICTCE